MADAEKADAERGRDLRGITVVDFYGNRVNAIKNSPFYERVKARETDYRLRPIAEHPRSTITGVSTQWSVFEKQAPVLELCARSNYALRAFSSEVAAGGLRSYIACHPEVFWKIYRQRNPLDRHFYEVIPEYLPCKLYLDLEFYREFNPGKDGENMLRTIVRLAVHLFEDKFGLKIDPNSTVIDLTASTEKKFSRHLIFDVPGVAFENSYEVGKFVKQMQYFIDRRNEIEGTVTSEELADLEVVKDAHGKRTSFIDAGVYTKNRNFRLFLSSKIGQTNPLVPTEMLKRFSTEKALFFASLVTVSYRNNFSLLSFDLPVEAGVDKEEKRDHPSAPNFPPRKSVLPSCKSLDRFIENLVSPGRVRRKFGTKSGEEIIFDIDSGYRFCGNVGRQHKSNHIKIVVDIPLRGFYQACWDPECRNYASPLRPLPEGVLEDQFRGSDPVELDWGDVSEEELSTICEEMDNCLKKQELQSSQTSESPAREVSMMCDELEKTSARVVRDEEEAWGLDDFPEQELVMVCDMCESMDGSIAKSDKCLEDFGEFSEQEVSSMCDALEKKDNEQKQQWGGDLGDYSEEDISMVCDAIESVAAQEDF